MDSVTVKRDELLEAVKKNMTAHRDLFLKAQKGYRAAVIGELDEMLEEARSGSPLRRTVELDEPIDRTEDYARVVAMLEMSVDDEIDINAHDFNCYVRDQWDWSIHATTINSAYAATVSG